TVSGTSQQSVYLMASGRPACGRRWVDVTPGSASSAWHVANSSQYRAFVRRGNSVKRVLILVLALLAVGSLGASINLLSNGNEGGAGGCMALCISDNAVYGAGLGLIGFLLAMAGGIVAAADSSQSGRRGWVWGLSIGVLLAIAGPMVGMSYFRG